MDKKVIFKAKRLDNGEWIEGFFTKKKLTSIFVPVIERIVENDNGEYMESIEVDGSTLQNIQEIQSGISENDFNTLKNEMNEETINLLNISDADKKILISMLDKDPNEIESLAKKMIPINNPFWCANFYKQGVEHKCKNQCSECIEIQKKNDL
jgi:hypothetical protein